MVNVYKTTVAEEIIGYDNGRKHVFVTVATSRTTDDTEGENVGLISTGGEIGVTLSKVGKISSIVPLPIGMVANANASLTCNITPTIDGEGNTVTITVLKANAGDENSDDKNLAVPAKDEDLVPASSENGVTSGVTFNFIAIGL